MVLTEKSEIRDVLNITDNEKQQIFDFLQGAVYCWCKNRPAEWFSMRDLMGGDNYYWEGTPLLVLYTKHENSGKQWEAAVKDSGWILKRVINEDKRLFETKKEELIRKYRWIKD